MPDHHDVSSENQPSPLSRWFSSLLDKLFDVYRHGWQAFNQYKKACARRRASLYKAKPSYMPTFEVLEVRETRSASTWTGAGSDDLWSTAANWTGSVVPGSGDEAIISGSSDNVILDSN